MSTNTISKLKIFAIILAFLPFSLLATEENEGQFNFSNEELLGFIDSNKEISELRKENNEKIEASVEEYNLTMERFNQIARASQIGALQGGTFSDEEVESFNAVGPIVSKHQRDMQTAMQMILEEKGLNTTKYQEIMRSYQQDQALQEHVRGLMRERAIEAAREAKRKEREEKENEGNEG
jgi:hypothetical protein